MIRSKPTLIGLKSEDIKEFEKVKGAQIASDHPATKESVNVALTEKDNLRKTQHDRIGLNK